MAAMTLLCMAALAVLVAISGAAARPVHSAHPLLSGRAPSSTANSAVERPPWTRRHLAASDARPCKLQLRLQTDGSAAQSGVLSTSKSGAHTLHPAAAALLASRSHVSHGIGDVARALLRLRSAAQQLLHGSGGRRGASRDPPSGGGNLQQALLHRSGRQLAQQQRSRRCSNGAGCVIAFSLLLSAAAAFLCCALICCCCCKRTSRQRPTAATLAAAAAARRQAGEPEAAAAEIMERQLVSKIGADHAMAGAECPVCLDTLCEVVLPCNHGCCHICLDKLITRGARLTLCPICRERIMPPTIEPVVVTAPGEVAASASPAAGGDGTSGGGADGGSDIRPGWRRMLPTPLPPREWVAVAWWRRRRQQRRRQQQPAPDQLDAPTGAIPGASPMRTDGCP